MKVFLTGGTGFIGQQIVRTMRLRGWEVYALVRDTNSGPARWLVESGCTLVPGDVTQPEGLAQAMIGMDVVMHNAGVYELGGNAVTQARMERVNVNGTDHVLGAAMQAEVARTVYVSSVVALGCSSYAPEPAVLKDETHAPDGRHVSPYNRSKADAHQVALDWRDKGLPLVIAMPKGFQGPTTIRSSAIFCACICYVVCLRWHLVGTQPRQLWIFMHLEKVCVWQPRMPR